MHSVVAAIQDAVKDVFIVENDNFWNIVLCCVLYLLRECGACGWCLEGAWYSLHSAFCMWLRKNVFRTKRQSEWCFTALKQSFRGQNIPFCDDR